MVRTVSTSLRSQSLHISDMKLHTLVEDTYLHRRFRFYYYCKYLNIYFKINFFYFYFFYFVLWCAVVLWSVVCAEGAGFFDAPPFYIIAQKDLTRITHEACRHDIYIYSNFDPSSKMACFPAAFLIF
jgi:hypothetical protein